MMNSQSLQQLYQEQLIKAGVEIQKARQASQILSVKEFQLIGDIWPEWETILAQANCKEFVTEQLIKLENHCSVYSLSKRLIDLIGALIGLGILSIIIIPIAIAIKLDSPGDVFYSQIRCGLKGKPFKIWKFRTMVANADQQKYLIENEVEGQLFKNKNDPRVTRVGKFLRSTSLDEFPQFWNVFRGEMSLVGTRPPHPEEVCQYQNHHYQRLVVKPGMTGEWQVNGRSSIKNFEEVVKMDLKYQQKWSPIYDLKLILNTIIVVFRAKGAY
ncbi:glycosyl transferase [Chroococcus sp. FPU101]|nr:glycosyl transferase [Chroococcus sp. FPU101]